MTEYIAWVSYGNTENPTQFVIVEEYYVEAPPPQEKMNE